jgi:sterol desaturase/sphingolipid hydroxylase (fatty acid hydroxylase superfamily)
MLKASPESPRMFESDFVDFFSRTHPIVVPLLFVPASAICFRYGLTHTVVGFPGMLVLFASGWLFWTLVEYWLHRTFFHWVPDGKWGERMHFLVHGVHHTWPKDKYRLVMPPMVSVFLFWLFLGLFLVALGKTYAWGFHAGFAIGYMTYDLTHYYIHHNNPKWKSGLALKKHHMLHHFKTPDSKFGVSTRLWDRVFGTL